MLIFHNLPGLVVQSDAQYPHRPLTLFPFWSVKVEHMGLAVPKSVVHSVYTTPLGVVKGNTQLAPGYAPLTVVQLWTTVK